MAVAHGLLVPPGDVDRVDAGGVGIVFKVPGAMTHGGLSVVEHPVLPGTLVPPHIHHTEDELSYILEGSFGFRIGDHTFEAPQGSYVYKPRNVPHSFWNSGPAIARCIEVIWPAGLESFFRELAEAFDAGGGEPDPAKLVELGDTYGFEYIMDWVPELEARHGVSVIHQGGRSS